MTDRYPAASRAMKYVDQTACGLRLTSAERLVQKDHMHDQFSMRVSRLLRLHIQSNVGLSGGIHLDECTCLSVEIT